MGLEDLQRQVVAGEAMALEGQEKVEDAFGGGRPAVAFFRIEGQRGDFGLGHPAAYLAFEEGVDEQGDKVEEQASRDNYFAPRGQLKRPGVFGEMSGRN